MRKPPRSCLSCTELASQAEVSTTLLTIAQVIDL